METQGRDALQSLLAGRSTPWRVLIAEDGAQFRASLERLLGAAGFETEAYGDGAAALARLLEKDRPPIDLVFADVMMPAMDGIELIATLKRDLESPPACLFMSGEVSAAINETPDRIEGVEILLKPFSADEMLAAIVRALR